MLVYNVTSCLKTQVLSRAESVMRGCDGNSKRHAWLRGQRVDRVMEGCNEGVEINRGWMEDKDSQSSSSRDDLNELLGDDGLSGAVEGEGQLVNHLS